VVSYCCHKFGVLDLGLNLAQSCGTCSRAAGNPSSPVPHDGGRSSILLRLLRRRMASSLRSARARKLFQSGRRKAACRGAAGSGAHEKVTGPPPQPPTGSIRCAAVDSICCSGPEGSRAGAVGFSRLLMSRKLLVLPPSRNSFQANSEINTAELHYQTTSKTELCDLGCNQADRELVTQGKEHCKRTHTNKGTTVAIAIQESTTSFILNLQQESTSRVNNSGLEKQVMECARAEQTAIDIRGTCWNVISRRQTTGQAF
jgi:hypothetical protein